MTLTAILQDDYNREVRARLIMKTRRGMTITTLLRNGLLCLCAWGIVLEAIPLYVDQDPWEEVEL